MPRPIKVYQIDSFTTKPFSGNPASVVLDADGLSEREMQQVAREMNNSETAFILRGNRVSYDFEIRFFTPTIEVPNCGHATIAAIYVLALHGSQSPLKIKTGAGMIEVSFSNDINPTIYIQQKPPRFLNILMGDRKKLLLEALGLSEDHFINNLPIQIVDTGHSKVIIPIQSRKVLNGIRPDFLMLSALSKDIQCNGYFVFTLDSPDRSILTYARMFAPAIGINEDPVTGNGNGPMGAYLVNYHVVPVFSSELKFKGVQGEAMNRRGEIEVNVKKVGDGQMVVTIGGAAVKVFETEIDMSYGNL